MLYRGRVGEEVIKLVHNSLLDGITFEGVNVRGLGTRSTIRLICSKSKQMLGFMKSLKAIVMVNMDLMARLL